VLTSNATQRLRRQVPHKFMQNDPKLKMTAFYF
jgi:hypothetical protein